MSIWTHVCGCIRVDSIRIGVEKDKDHDKIVHAIERGIPCGSEGPIKYDIWINRDRSCIAAYTVSIFGDLRDYDDIEEIESWFRNACENLLVRNAVIHIEVENGNKKTITI